MVFPPKKGMFSLVTRRSNKLLLCVFYNLATTFPISVWILWPLFLTTQRKIQKGSYHIGWCSLCQWVNQIRARIGLIFMCITRLLCLMREACHPFKSTDPVLAKWLAITTLHTKSAFNVVSLTMLFIMSITALLALSNVFKVTFVDGPTHLIAWCEC